MQTRWKLISLIMVVAIGILMGLYYHHSSGIKSQHKTNDAPPQLKPANSGETNQSTTISQNRKDKKPVLKTEELTTKQQAILAEIEGREFSDDPYIEVLSLGVKIGICSDELDFTNLFQEQGGHSQQQELLSTLEKTCTDYAENYPHVLSMSERQLKNLFKPTSQHGLLMQNQSNQNLTPVEREENTKLNLFYALKEKNSSLLITSAFMQRFGGGNQEPLKMVLNSTDIAYLGQMSQLALALLSCEYQSGQSCRPTSMLMVLICSQDPDSCGMDFPTWYQRNTLPGMRSDVEKLMTYYQQLRL